MKWIFKTHIHTAKWQAKIFNKTDSKKFKELLFKKQIIWEKEQSSLQ